jgi:hypothetical protein
LNSDICSAKQNNPDEYIYIYTSISIDIDIDVYIYIYSPPTIWPLNSSQLLHLVLNQRNSHGHLFQLWRESWLCWIYWDGTECIKPCNLYYMGDLRYFQCCFLYKIFTICVHFSPQTLSMYVISNCHMLRAYEKWLLAIPSITLR